MIQQHVLHIHTSCYINMYVFGFLHINVIMKQFFFQSTEISANVVAVVQHEFMGSPYK